MSSNEDLKRNRPSNGGTGNDPNIRDDSAIQPNVNTISKSNTDKSNEKLTKTAADDFRATESNENADPVFDEIGDED